MLGMVNERQPAGWPGRMTHPRHVWIEGNVSSPGVLLMWRQTQAGAWEGWCIWADYYAPHENLSVRQGWVPADRIKRAGSEASPEGL